jgi:hypothetical protein
VNDGVAARAAAGVPAGQMRSACVKRRMRTQPTCQEIVEAGLVQPTVRIGRAGRRVHRLLLLRQCIHNRQKHIEASEGADRVRLAGVQTLHGRRRLQTLAGLRCVALTRPSLCMCPSPHVYLAMYSRNVLGARTHALTRTQCVAQRLVVRHTFLMFC